VLNSTIRGDENGGLRDSSQIQCLTKPVKQSELLEAVNAASEVPVTLASNDALMPASAQRVKEALNILLVEDNPVNQKLAQRVLERNGHAVVLADNGASALELLEKGDFDVVLMDVQMPRMDGIETTLAIRNKEKDTGKHVSIIALTAHAMTGDRERCLQAGMDGYLIKPIQPASLLKVVEALRPRSTQGFARPAISSCSVLDRASLLERVDGDMGLLNEVASLCLRDCSKLMTETRDAISSRDASRLSYMLHTMGGMFRNVSAHSALQIISRLQSVDLETGIAKAEAEYGRLEQEVRSLTAELARLTEQVAA